MLRKIISIIVTLLAMSCSIDKNDSIAVLTINMVNNVRNIEPDIAISSYDVSISHSDGKTTIEASFSPVDTIKFADLIEGDWTATVEAYNGSEELIGTGSSLISLILGDDNTLSIDLNPITTTGVGTANIALTLPVGEFTNPIITSTLTKAGEETPSDITFSEIVSNTANYTASDLDVGYYTLSVSVAEDYGNEHLDYKAGKTVVIRIVDGIETTGTISLLAEDREGFSIQTDYLNPIDLVLTGVLATDLGLDITITTPSVADITFTWFLDGQLITSTDNGTVSSITIGSTLLPGDHSLTCIAKGTNILSSITDVITINGGATIPTLTVQQARGSVDLTWTRSTDDNTPSRELLYKLVIASSDSDIDTVEEADVISGSGILMDWTSYTYSFTPVIDAIEFETPYYVRLLVKDTDGHITITTTAGSYIIPAIIYVSPTGVDGAQVSSSSEPFLTIEKAVAYAVASAYASEIRVEKGTYTPASGIVMIDNLKLLGGYESGFATIGDLTDVANLSVVESVGTVEGTSLYSVKFDDTISRNTLVEGFHFSKITGAANENHSQMLIYGSPTIKNNFFTIPDIVSTYDNACMYVGGATAAPVIDSNVFIATDVSTSNNICVNIGATSSPDTVISNNIFNFDGLDYTKNIYGVSYSTADILISNNIFYSTTGGVKAVNIYNTANKGTIIGNYFNLIPSDIAIHEADSTADPKIVENNQFSTLSIYYKDEFSTDCSDLTMNIVNDTSGDLESWGNTEFTP